MPAAGEVKVDGATVAGVTEFDAADATDSPTAFVAVTLNVYAVPLVKPVTVNEVLLPVPVAVRDPGVDVAL